MKFTPVIVALATCAIANAEPTKEGKKKGSAGDRPVSAEILEKYDTDKDGKLSADERKAAMEARRAETLAKYDKDGDGKLSTEERKAASEARRAEMIKQFDKDGDGKLSDEEKAEIRKAMPARGERRGNGEKGRKDKAGKSGKGKAEA